MDFSKIRLFLFDMDGTLYLGNNLFPFTKKLLETIKEQGKTYLFMTNNSSKSVNDYVKKLEKLGIPAKYEDFITSSQATADYLVKNHPGLRFYVSGTESFKKELAGAGVDVHDKYSDDIEGVVMGYDTELTYQKLDDVSKLLTLKDIPYIAANPDWVCPTEYGYVPDCGDVPLVADMSSCIISEPVDVTKFGVIYAGAQKNMAPAGLTLVIVREDLLGLADESIPTMLDWKTMADNDSMYNTPPCYAIYMAGLVYDWIKSIGGLDAMKELNEKKAKLLYDYLDSQSYYIAPVKPDSRSMMNVTFVTGDAELDKKFAKQAAEAGLKNLKGHRSVGGMRASIYNAMPYEGVEALVAFMDKFAKENPKA
jgi:phosphoserine aminotransferase